MLQKNKLTDEEINGLQKAIFDLHATHSEWLMSVPVKETFQGRIAWEGIVEVFELIDHPTAKKCYAWSHLVDESGKREFIAVLHKEPIDSPHKAVQAAIVSEFRNTGE